MDKDNLNNGIDDATSDPVDRLLEPKKPASTGKGIALFALLLAVVAVAGTGWMYWQSHTGEPDQAQQQQALAEFENSQQQLARSVESMQSQLDTVESPLSQAELGRLRGRLKTAENQLDELLMQGSATQASTSALQGGLRSLEQRVSTTESGLISVAASSQNSSVELDIAEIDFLLRAASERLQLFSDPVAAELALLAADSQIEALDDPLYLSVRQQIASARQALAGIPRVDRVQISAQLSELQLKVPALPFHGEQLAEPAVEPGAEPPEDAGWWASFKHSLSSLVTVRRRVPEEQSLISLEDKDYLRQGLWLQLESARLALMRTDASVFDASLQRVAQTIERYFHNGAPEVQAFQLQVADLQQVEVAPGMPDISGPWTQLRQLRDSRRLLQGAPVAEPDNEPQQQPEGDPEQ